jgi:lipid II:glycine glycyltransferase (peptidoglycan interpeptide bridge formation enzyme)
MYKKADDGEKVCLKKSPTDVQPPDTVLLPLDKTEEELLSAMKPKWRYNIRLAEKKGVTVRAAGAESIESFYKVFMETAARDRIAVHGKDYYKSLLELSADGSHVKTTLYIAEHEGETLAGIITLFTDTEAVYLYGASSDNKRNLMPAYLLQWTAIQDAKKFGSKVYDFYGIPPTDDEHHPMHGLYRFKTGFGGTVVHRAGSLDMPVKPLFYTFYILLEKLRAFYFKKVRKLLKHR